MESWENSTPECYKFVHLTSSHCTWKIKKVILSNDSSWAFAAANTEQVLRSLNCVYFFHCWEDVYCVSPKNSQHDQVLYVPVAIKQRDISASRLLRTRPNFSKSVRFLLRYQNSVIPTSFSLNLTLKSTASIAEICCWCTNCSQWSAAWLQIDLSWQCTNTHVALMTWSIASAPWDTPFTNLEWPANITGLNPVDYRILRCCLSEI